MTAFLRCVRLMKVLFNEGTLRHSGLGFQHSRREALKDLLSYCPEEYARKPAVPAWKRRMLGNATFRALLTNASFIKNSLRREGGHLCAPALNLCYVRIPKAASTALSYPMLTAQFPELRMRRLSYEQINFLTDVNLLGQVAERESKAQFFTVVRNPFARIVSVYRAFFEKAGPHFIYQDYLFGILSRHLSFKEFVSRVQLIPDSWRDQHLKSQCFFLKYYAKKGVVVKVLKLENTTSIGTFFSAHGGLSFEPLNRSEIPYDYRNYYDRQTADIVALMYQQDIASFGYESAYEELIRQHAAEI